MSFYVEAIAHRVPIFDMDVILQLSIIKYYN